MATERVLVLGAGHVVGPAVQYLTREPRTSVTVVSQFQEELDNIKQKFPGVHTVQMDLSLGYSELERHLDNHDIVISLLPCHFHPDIAKLCIQHKKSMLTASYVSPEMKELHHVAKEAGITILNEVGLDPGIDHMLAIQCIDEVQKAGGKITSFSSYCGGLPAPENNDTPLLYKFSWYPKGALMNLMSSAKYLKNGSIVEVPGKGGLLDAVENLTFMPGLNLEGFPNRDSTVYATEYGIESAHTIYRGTIRYKKIVISYSIVLLRVRLKLLKV
ncbi:alpha-aminoadipic semialdehyde synthase, mitochondrial-like [Physella acuta]|uniref:alpha-aminoadipic semialdehyde synthase, mitochondrial-like n=1 Tax=Physella acuta TaxID=109671 RepID=UPI0027DE8F9F|nr:alpha-aminoadipic semialdehyde synthase, mitochondrial-like [Physella acuta]